MRKIYFLYSAGLFLLSGLLLSAKGQTFPLQNKPGTKTQVDSVRSGNIRPVPSAYASGSKVNYVRTRDALGRITSETDFNNADYTSVKESTQYIDGLGRPLQIVTRQITPGLKDLVAPVIYDELNREPYKYLPYVQTSGSHTNDGKFKLSPFVDQSTFYKNNSLNPGCKGEQAFYSLTLFETSPLNRVIRTCAPGNSWAGHDTTNGLFYGMGNGVSQLLQGNDNNDSVRTWEIDYDTLTYSASDTTFNIPTTSGIYGSAMLYKTVTSDENGNKTYEYYDFEGKLILKKVLVPGYNSGSFSDGLCTYYVYDDFKRLRFVIPPKAVSWLYRNGWGFSTAGGRSQIVQELCFRYEYDSRGRMIAKKVPGAGWVYMVYDARDRLVFSQDANMRAGNQWMATLYDDVNRPVTTGLITYTGNRSTLQNYVTVQTGSSADPVNKRLLFATSTNRTDLLMNTPAPPVPIIKAKRSVTLKSGFSTMPGNPVLIKIDNAPAKADSAIIANNPLPVLVDSLVVLTQIYYDNYNWSPSVTYNESYKNKLDSGNNVNFETVPTLAEQQKVFTKGLVTISRVRVIEDPANIPIGDFLTTTNFYDDRERLLQVQSDNYKTGKDTITNRFDFSGNILCTYVTHNNPAAGSKGIVKVKTNLDYDAAGRLLKVWKTINDSSSNKQLIVSNSYDELGRMNNKELGALDGLPIETLGYEYNIRGWLKSINRDYTNDGLVPDRWFGEELCYDWGFDSVQYNGNISGVKWRSKGTDTRRAYGYAYDNASRLMGADYSEGSVGTFYENPIVNYDMQMGNAHDPFTAYDENGNILAMKQWGQNLYNSQVIDNLAYNYTANSNKLLNVIDTANDAQTKLGDFRTSSLHPNYGNKTTGTVDYTYDANGNLLKDLNKDIGTSSVSGVQYNHLNLPYKITVYGSGGMKGTITYIYDAAGNKLEKRVTDSGTADTKTDYIGPFVYENNQLQFFAHEEGRTRYAKKYFVNGDSTFQFIQDYFVKDHLGNVRMVLTEQKDTARYIATMEPAYRAKEDALFNNVTLTAYPDSLVPGGYPVDTSVTNPNSYVSRLNGSGNMIGPSIVLKVMSGDKIDLATKAFYVSQGARGASSNSLGDIIAALANGIISVSGTTKGTFSDLTNTSPIHDAVNLFLFARDDNDTVTVKPKAYINWIAFDDHLAPNSFGAIPVGAANTLNTLSTSITASQNGYFYIYVSNETQNWDVFFDNLVVNHRTGPLLEEYHYYPFGLTMAGISDKALKSNYAENKKRFAHQDFENDLDWDMYLFRFRAHDPQIGRFIQIDPLAKSFPYNSTYAFAENRVGNGTDLEGLEWWASPLVFGNNTTILRGPVLENAVEATVEAGAKISEVGGKVSEGTTKPKFSPEQLQRFREGRKIEAEQLEKNGLEKNNKPIEIIDPKTGKTGETVPDAFKNDGQSTVEIKNVKSQGLSRQLRLQQKYSNDNGFNPELIINKGAQISKPLQNSTFDIKYYNSVPPAAKDAINQGLPKAKPVPEKPVQPASKPCTCGTPCCI